MFYQKNSRVIINNFFLRGLFIFVIFSGVFLTTNRVVLAAPAIFDISPEAGSRVISSTVLSFSSTELDDIGCQIDGSNWGRPCNGLTFAAIPGWGNLFDGEITLTLSGVDLEGNIVSTSTTYTRHTASSSVKQITSFEFEGLGAGVIDQEIHTILVTVPFGTDVTALTADIQITNSATINIHDAVQDFSDPVTYTITAEDESTQNYVVTVVVAPFPAVVNLSDDLSTTTAKTWSWDSNSPNSVFRFIVDQLEDSTPSGDYSNVTTTTKDSGDGTYYLHVQAKDLAGNESEVVSVSAILDNTAPIITLSGSNPVSLTVGDSFSDPGATAVDNLDGIVTVTTSGSVDTNNTGEYTITYEAQDGVHNTSTKTRTVVVNSAPSGGGGGSSGGGSSRTSSVSATTTEIVPETSGGVVLGITTFRFLIDLSLGMENNDVRELQTRLIKDGYLTVPATGYFGPKTLAAVKSYQLAHRLPTTGFFGPMTRSIINKELERGYTVSEIDRLIQQINYLQSLLDSYKNK